MATTAAEITWLSYLLTDLHISQPSCPILFCDNLSALQLTVNPVFHARSKHIEIDYHYVREQVALHKLQTQHVSSSEQLADMSTKALLLRPFSANVFKLGIVPLSRLRGDVRNV